MTNLIDQAKTIMQGCGNVFQLNNSINYHCQTYKNGQTMHCPECKAKASQMLIDLTNEKEFLIKLDFDDMDEIQMADDSYLNDFLSNRLKEINSAIEILEGK
jgi:hypothetical protein